MEIGPRLRQARLEKGLSQRQLCQDLITRNMLSQIENGSARPSMEVLCTLAARLEKPVSYFLEEGVSSNQTVIEEARRAYTRKDWAGALKALEAYQRPDALLDEEWAMIQILCCLALAEQALTEGKKPYAAELLERCGVLGAGSLYYSAALGRRRQLLLARLGKGPMPDMDAELLLLAQDALEAMEPGRAVGLLETMAGKDAPQWYFLRGLAALQLGQYPEAAECFHKAEVVYPEETAEKLEICYRELEDYKKAYFYATKRRGTV